VIIAERYQTNLRKACFILGRSATGWKSRKYPYKYTFRITISTSNL